MRDWLGSYTVRALLASLLLDVGAAFGVAAAGGDVGWALVGWGIANKAAIGVARVLLGEPVRHPQSG